MNYYLFLYLLRKSKFLFTEWLATDEKVVLSQMIEIFGTPLWTKMGQEYTLERFEPLTGPAGIWRETFNTHSVKWLICEQKLQIIS